MSKRTYNQFCGLAQALDVVGERWTLLIVRELMLGPRRYSDLREALDGIGTSLLAERLKHLESEDVVRRSYLPPPAASTVYELTDDGRSLADALLPLTAWGAKRLSRAPRRGEEVRIGWIMQFLKSRSDASASRGVRETYEIRLPPGTFHVHADDGDLAFHEGGSAAPDLVVEADLEAFASLGAGPVSAKRPGRLSVSGDRRVAARALEVLRPGA